jgi:NADH-quinone oxidoreductase subunit K
MIPIGWYLILSAILFLIGVLGFFIKRKISGQIFVFFVLVVAAAEAAVGLALVIAMFRNRESLNVDRSNLLKW